MVCLAVLQEEPGYHIHILALRRYYTNRHRYVQVVTILLCCCVFFTTDLRSHTDERRFRFEFMIVIISVQRRFY